IARGEAKYVPQDGRARRVMPQRRPEDGRVDWSWPASRIYDFVRAQTMPYPGAFSHLDGYKVTIWSATPQARAAAPQDGGRILDVGRSGMLVGSAASGALL